MTLGQKKTSEISTLNIVFIFTEIRDKKKDSRKPSQENLLDIED
jgi:hypothetical protein